MCMQFLSLLEFNVLATFKVTSGRIPIGDFIVLPNWKIRPPVTQSHYPDTKLTSPHSILLMPSARLGSDKYQFCKSLLWLDQESNRLLTGHTGSLSSTNSATTSSHGACSTVYWDWTDGDPLTFLAIPELNSAGLLKVESGARCHIERRERVCKKLRTEEVTSPTPGILKASQCDQIVQDLNTHLELIRYTQLRYWCIYYKASQSDVSVQFLKPNHWPRFDRILVVLSKGVT